MRHPSRPRSVSSHSELTPRSELDVLRTIVERVPDGLVVIDTSGRLVFFNPAAKRMIGLGSKDVDPANWAATYGLYRLDGTPFESHRLPLVRALAGESVVDCKLVVRNEERQRGVVISVNAEPLVRRTGRAFGALATFRDVSSAYRASQITDHIAAIEYRELVTALHEGLWMCDEAGTTMYVNEQMAELLGYQVSEMVGRPSFEFFPEERLEACHRHLERRCKGITEDYETELLARDGRRVIAIVQASPLYGHNQKYRGSLAGVLDITNRKEAERELKSAREGLERLVEDRTIALRRALEEVGQLKEQLESENVTLREQVLQSTEAFSIVGRSDALQRALQQISQVAQTDSSVLLSGETGTGKGLFAVELHRQSHLADRPLVTVDCATLPPTLIESELFGHEKGAFTGAGTARAGRFELADGGTLFLDEIGEIPLDAQARLLRFLQSGEFERVGSTKTRKVRVRIICATNRDLRTMVREKTFRSDLFFRLNVFPIRVPALRERLEDLPQLVRHFIRRKKHGVKRLGDDVAPEVIDLLSRYSWPGNVRELENVVERATILATGERIEVQDLSGALTVDPHASTGVGHDEPPVTLQENERRFLLEALRACQWKVKGPGNAAERAGLPPSTFRDRMVRLGIRRPSREKDATGRGSVGPART